MTEQPIALVDMSSEEFSDRVAAIIKARGIVPNLYRVLLHKPEVATHWLDFGTTLAATSAIDASLRELAICLVGRRRACEYVLHHHDRLAGEAGLSSEQLAVLDSWTEHLSLFRAEQQSVLRFVDDALSARPGAACTLADSFDSEQAVEIALIVATYDFLSTICLAFEIPADTDHATL